MAGNQLGKTIAGGAEWAFHLTGRYPSWWVGKEFYKPVRMWAAGVTGEITRDQAHDHVRKHIGRVFKSVEFKWTPAGHKFSMDAKIRGFDPSDDRSLHDVVSDGLYEHWSEQMEEDRA